MIKKTSTASLPLKKIMHLRKTQNCGRVKHLIIGLWFLTPLSTIFQLYGGGQFISSSNSMIYKKLHRKPKDRATWTSLKTEGELGCSRWVGSSCSTSGTRRVTLVISHEWGKDLHVLTTSGTYTWSFVTQTNFIT